MHVSYTSAITADRRKQKMDDVAKRSEYRKAHGIDSQEGMLGGWTAKSDAETMGPAQREGGVTAAPAAMDASPVAVEAAIAAADDESFVDFEGKRQLTRKKWFGIW